MTIDLSQSVYRERLLEHLLIGAFREVDSSSKLYTELFGPPQKSKSVAG